MAGLAATGTAGTHGAVRTNVLRATVRRLDALGHLDRLLSRLPDPQLLGPDGRVLVLEIVLARDPAYLIRQIRSLLSTFWPIDGADPREAWLAYQLYRALPSGQRQALENDGTLESIVGALPVALRHDLGLTAFVGSPGGAERQRLLGRLAEPRLWREQPRATELRTLVRMTITAGLQREAFEDPAGRTCRTGPGWPPWSPTSSSTTRCEGRSTSRGRHRPPATAPASSARSR